MTDYQSSSLYPNSDVLVNYFDLKEQEKLDLVEGILTTNRLMELEHHPLEGEFDLTHLKAIHFHIFQDIYPFVGKIRTENLAKGSFSFAAAPFIIPAATQIFNQLKEECYLSNLPLDTFCERAAFFMAELNALHPFREGNGRTIREFIRLLALYAGWKIDWNCFNGDEMLEVMIKSPTDYEPLSKLLHEGLQ
ncbi:Fic/DOC family protein [Halalkalibacillus halophilus]|uniref:Fic/DOC family protein n=1 Tax=Halalkalibacillus halophilus TaxID=392827 RepID=UPI00041547DB|nr:Fic family protein [Halalkalibacillus halophilus]